MIEKNENVALATPVRLNDPASAKKQEKHRKNNNKTYYHHFSMTFTSLLKYPIQKRVFTWVVLVLYIQFLCSHLCVLKFIAEKSTLSQVSTNTP